MGVDLNLIRPWNMNEAGLDLEVNPANTAMDTERIRQDLGIEPPPVQWTVKHRFMLEKQME